MELHTDADVTGIGEVNVCIGSNPEVIRAMTEQMAELFVGDTRLAPAAPLKISFGSMYYIQAQSDLDATVGQTHDAVERGFGTIYFKVAIEEERDGWSSSGERPGAHPGRARVRRVRANPGRHPARTCTPSRPAAACAWADEQGGTRDDHPDRQGGAA